MLALTNDPENAKKENAKRAEGQVFSALDMVLTEEEFYLLLETKSQKVRNLSRGQIDDERGRKFEINLSNCLSDISNLKRWKGDSLQNGRDYELFCLVMDYLNEKPENILCIEATTDIERLPSGGMPKTDVYAILQRTDGTSESVTISCKRSSRKKVSVHQYKAEEFIRVLGIEDKQVQESLMLLQKAGGSRNLEKEKGGIEAAACLNEHLPEYNDKLIRWVLGGFGGEGTGIQCADYIMVYNDADDGY